MDWSQHSIPAMRLEARFGDRVVPAFCARPNSIWAMIADAGAFSMVIEAVAEPLARKITETVAIPTIGIGASAACDGQVLVLEDMLGLSPRAPKFVRRYGNLGPMIEKAIEGYASDVRSRAFPGPEHVYGMKTKS